LELAWNSARSGNASTNPPSDAAHSPNPLKSMDATVSVAFAVGGYAQ
jgi:hypothetical protein